MQSVNFDRAADFYDETRGFPPGEETGAVMQFVKAGNLTPSSRVGEVGIGTGRLALPLAAHVGAIAGIDLSGRMLNRLYAKRTTEPVVVTQGDATRLPFPSGTFDAVVASHIFHLIPGWRDALREVARVLRPGGRLLHAWNDSDRDDRQMLWNAWDRVVWQEHTPPPNVGVPREQYDTFLPDSGWQLVGETHTHPYTVERPAGQFIDRIERRVWSSCWRLDDAVIEAGLAAVRAVMQQHGITLTDRTRQEASFNVQAYLPPGEL